MGDQDLKFIEVDYPEPHRQWTKDLLARHPEVKELFGHNPWTALICVAVVGLQVGIAAYAPQMPWWALPIVAWCVGAFLVTATFAIIHETSHKRVFRGRLANEVVGWIANLPSLVPSSSSFRNYHMKHHRYQGDPEYDADLATEAEARFVGRSTLRKILWQIAYPVIQSVRTIRFQKNGKIPFWTKWVVGNVVVQFAFDAAIVYFFGWQALVYLFLSFFFSVGLHPLSARLIQEHFVVHEDQETYSYYGILNLVALNVYYHNEHHDFPAVAWHNLPRVRAMASEHYDSLYAHESLFKLWLRFLFDPELTLHHRVVRDYSAGTADGSSRTRALAPASGGDETQAEPAAAE